MVMLEELVEDHVPSFSMYIHLRFAELHNCPLGEVGSDEDKITLQAGHFKMFGLGVTSPHFPSHNFFFGRPCFSAQLFLPYL